MKDETLGLILDKEKYQAEYQILKQNHQRVLEIKEAWPPREDIRCREVCRYSFNEPFPIVDAALHEFFIFNYARPEWNVRRSDLTSGSVIYSFYYPRSDSSSVFELRARMVERDLTYLTGYLTEAPNPPDLLITIGKQLKDNGEPDLDNPSVELIAIVKMLCRIFFQWFDTMQEERRIQNESGAIIKFIADKEVPQGAPASLVIDFRDNEGYGGSQIYYKDQVSERLQSFLRERPTQPGRGTHTSWEEDDWAWEEVNVRGRPRKEVRQEWLQRISSNRPELKDIARSFRHAVDPKRKVEINPED